MSSLGSVLAPDPAAAGRPRGPDLHVVIEVPPSALGATEGFAAALPLQIPHAGERVVRAVLPGEEEFLRLHLPPDLPSGAVLRLRGQGGVCEGGGAGDLFARIVVSDSALPAYEVASTSAHARLVWISAAVLVILGLGLLSASL